MVARSGRPAPGSTRFNAFLLYKSRQIYAEPMPSISKFLWFQCQAFPKKALGVLWDFKVLQGSKSENDVSPNICPAEWVQIACRTRSIRPDLTERRRDTVTQLAFLKKINRQKIGQQINQAKTDDLPAGAKTISTKAAARLDHSPNERMPVVPYLFSLRGAEVRDELRWRREIDWHDAAELVIIEDGPT